MEVPEAETGSRHHHDDHSTRHHHNCACDDDNCSRHHHHGACDDDNHDPATHYDDRFIITEPIDSGWGCTPDGS
jgi:hypothetical protein